MAHHFALQQTVAPASEPLTLAEAKLWVRVDADDVTQDGLIAYLIAGARERFEELTGRALIAQTWVLQLDRFPSWPLSQDHSGDYYRLGADADPRNIRLCRPPLLSVSSVVYTDTAGVTQTLSPSAYQVDTLSEPARLLPVYGTYWPVARVLLGAVQVTYQAGFGASAAAVPARYKERLLAHVAYCYREREAPDQDFLDSLFAPFALGDVG